MTFAEKIKEHNKYCGELLDRAEKLISQASSKKDSSAEHQKLIQEAETTIQLVGAVMQGFENEHAKELKMLELYVNRSGNGR